MNWKNLTVLLLLLIVVISAAGQSKDPQKASTRKAPDADEAQKNLEAERIRKERRATAQSLLINLAADARNFSDQTLRARTQARIADALWEADRDRSRTIFRAAWEAAELADVETQRRIQEEIKQQQAKTGRGSFVIGSQPELRKEVLSMVAKRDRALGEELLTKLREQKEREASEAKNRNSSSWWADPATRARLELAQELVAAGDVERGLQFADPVLSSITIQSVEFLTLLRERDAAAADRRYASMLASAAANPQSDATTVSLLTSYIFTPHLYISFSNAGTSSSQMTGRMVVPDVSPDLRASYFQTASTILLRPLAPPGQEQTSSGPDGQYQMITRLLPLFEQYAPPAMTAALRAQQEVVAASASENARKRDNEWLTRGLNSERPPVDQEQAILDQIEHVKTSAERDQLYLQLAFLFSEKGDVRARDFVDKIDELELRKAAKAYIDPALVLLAIQKKNADRALELGTSGELTHVQRSYLNAQVAKLLAKTNQERALALIEDAVAEARRVDTSDPDRPRAFFGAANALLIVDKPRVWELITDAVRASNSAEGFTGEDGQIVLRVISKGQNLIQERPVSDFDLKGIFQELAADNFEKAVDVARGFEKVAPRANAVIAIARKILDQKNK